MKQLLLWIAFALAVIYFVVNNIYYLDAIYLFNTKVYNLSELIIKNNLSKETQRYGYCFDTNEQIKSLAYSLKSVYDVQKYILDFPYEEAKNRTSCIRATEILKRGKGNCLDKAVLACVIFYEKNIPCYVVGGKKPYHSIALIHYNGGWRPILTTGSITPFNIDEFMNSVFIVESKHERYFRTF